MEGVDVNVGEKVTSYDQIANELNLGYQQVRTAIGKLKLTGELTVKSTNKYSLFKLNNFNDYQQVNEQTNSQVTIKQRTSNEQVTTNNNDKNIKNDKNISRQKIFSDEVKKLSDFLFALIKENNEGFKGDPRKWDDDFDKLLRIDQRPYEEVARLIQLTQQDSFWKSNILSGKKFREKYDQLLMKLSTQPTSNLAFIS